MKKTVIKSMIVLSLMMAGTVVTPATISAQTQEQSQVEETPAQRKAREKAEKKAAKEAEKRRKAEEKAEAARRKEEEKIAKIIAAQKAAEGKNASATAQPQQPTNSFGPEWGNTAEAAAENVKIFNFYQDAYNNKDYDKALDYMYQLINNCPAARSNIYVWGANIYRTKIARSRSLDEKGVNIDSLMHIYDYRLAAFADDPKYGRSYILKQKARDYYKYRAEDKAGMLKLFREAIEVDESIDATFINQYFTVLVEEYEALNVETDHFMSEYEYLANKMDQVTDEEAKTSFDALLIKSGAADCNNLEQIFSARLAEDPENAAQIEKAFKLLLRNECQSEFFFTVGEKYYKNNPTTQNAEILSAAFEKNKQFDKALEYLIIAMESESDPLLKANLCVRLSGTELAADNAVEAANYAKKAIELNAELAPAYLCLAQAYVSGSTACADFDKQTVFWLAYDLTAKARNLFEGNEQQQATASSLMATYREYFPSQSDCFFRGLQEGDNFKVSCGWINGSTTVKVKK